MLDTMDAYGALNYADADAEQEIMEQKYAVAEMPVEEAQSQETIDLVKWFQKAGYMPYVSGDTTFRDIVAKWKASDWDQLIGHIADAQIIKDAPPEEQARFKDYLYRLKGKAEKPTKAAPPKAADSQVDAPKAAPNRIQPTITLAQPQSMLSKVAPMPIVQLGLAGLGYYVGDRFKSPYLGAIIGASVIPMWKAKGNPAVYHLRGLYGSMTSAPPTECPPNASCKTQKRSWWAYSPIGLGAVAVALSYSRNKNVLKSIGAGFIAPIYLAYVGIEYAKKKMK